MPRDALVKWGLRKGHACARFKTPCKALAPLKNAMRLTERVEYSSNDTPAATMDNERDDALIALAVRVWYRR